MQPLEEVSKELVQFPLTLSSNNTLLLVSRLVRVEGATCDFFLDDMEVLS